MDCPSLDSGETAFRGGSCRLFDLFLFNVALLPFNAFAPLANFFFEYNSFFFFIKNPDG
jgi:hypothetical protein